MLRPDFGSTGRFWLSSWRGLALSACARRFGIKGIDIRKDVVLHEFLQRSLTFFRQKPWCATLRLYIRPL